MELERNLEKLIVSKDDYEDLNIQSSHSHVRSIFNSRSDSPPNETSSQNLSRSRSENLGDMNMSQIKEYLSSNMSQVPIVNCNGDHVDSVPQSPKKLDFPKEETWDVFVSYVYDGSTIYFRILDYNCAFEELTDSMNEKYASQMQDMMVSKVEENRYYAVYAEGGWDRVKVVQCLDQIVNCHFIDHGHYEEFAVTDLRHLAPEFMKLAPQAVPAQLQGLYDLAEDENLIHDLVTSTLGRSLVAKVQYNHEKDVNVVLFDTSSSKGDININDMLLSKFANNNNKSSLPNGTVTEKGDMEEMEATVASQESIAEQSPNDLQSTGFEQLPLVRSLKMPTIPDVWDFFDVNVRLATSPENFIIQSWQESGNLANLLENMNHFYKNFERSGKSVMSEELDKEDYYAGYVNENWYRVEIVSTIETNSVVVHLVDYGDYLPMPIDDLQPLLPEFRKLPMQAIRASLRGITSVLGKDWRTEDTLWFKEKVVNRQFVARILAKECDKVFVSLIDTSLPKDDIIIEQLMVSENRAVKKC